MSKLAGLDEWERIVDSEYDNAGFLTERLKVFGGWMVINLSWDDNKHTESQSSIFVPDPNHEWSLE
jgi:hypothetical protein